MNRDDKAHIVSNLNDLFNKVSLVVVTHYSGLTVAEATDLRRRMREADAVFQVTKNRLAKRALEGTQYSPMEEMFSGPVAIAVSEDPVAAAKVIKDFNNDYDLPSVKGILFEGDYLPAEEFNKIASLPSKEESITKFAMMIKSPMQNLAMMLKSPMSDFVNVLNSIKESKSS